MIYGCCGTIHEDKAGETILASNGLSVSANCIRDKLH